VWRNKGHPLKNIIKRIRGSLIKPNFYFGGISTFGIIQMILNEGGWVSGEMLKVHWVWFASIICLYLNMLFFGVLFVFLNFAVFMFVD
jgi:hypothetical protein